jgi:hypothetical protein
MTVSRKKLQNFETAMKQAEIKIKVLEEELKQSDYKVHIKSCI